MPAYHAAVMQEISRTAEVVVLNKDELKCLCSAVQGLQLLASDEIHEELSCLGSAPFIDTALSRSTGVLLSEAPASDS